MDEALAEIDAALRGKCSEAGRQLDMFQRPQIGEMEMGEVVQSEQPAPLPGTPLPGTALPGTTLPSTPPKRKAKRVAAE